MKLRTLLTEYKKVKPIKSLIKYKKPKYDFTKFIIEGYLSFFVYNIREDLRPIKPGEKLYRSKGKDYDNKVVFMKNNLNKIISSIDSYCDSFPQNINHYKFPKIDDPVVFLKEFKKFLIYVNTSYGNKLSALNNDIKNKTITHGSITDYNKFNNGIDTFNKVLQDIYHMFLSIPEKDQETQTIYFNDNEKDIYNKLIKDIRIFKLDPLNIPDEPILMEVDDGDLSWD